MTQIKCAIIGCGRIVEDIHIHVFRSIQDLSVEAICDSNEHRLEEFGNRWGISKRYTDVNELLHDNPNLDFVSISTPGFTHYEICKQVIGSGFNVFVEKPLTLSLAEALDIQELARSAGVKVCVGQSYRFRDSIIKAKGAQQNGLIGEIRQVNCVHHGKSLFSEPTRWSWEERKHKVLLYEMTIHLIDLEVFFAGPVRRIIGFDKRVDENSNITTCVYAIVEHETGAVGLIDLQLFSSSNFTRFELYGRSRDIIVKLYPEHCCIRRGHVTPLHELSCELRRLGELVHASLRERVHPNAVKRRALPHYRLLRQFVRHLKDESVPNPVPIESVLPTMELLEELGRSTYG